MLEFAINVTFALFCVGGFVGLVVVALKVGRALHEFVSARDYGRTRKIQPKVEGNPVLAEELARLSLLFGEKEKRDDFRFTIGSRSGRYTGLYS